MATLPRWARITIAFMLLAWGPFWFLLGLPSQLQTASEMWPKIVRDPMFSYIIIWMPMLFGMAVIILSEWDRVRRWFRDEKPPRELTLNETLDFLFETTKTDNEHLGAKFLQYLQQEARDERITVWARVGHRGADLHLKDGVYEPVAPEVFASDGFQSEWGVWMIQSPLNRHSLGKVYYDPMFNRSEIKSLSRRLIKTFPVS